MILSVNNLLSYGLPISTECDETEVERAIKDVEYMVAQRIGVANYNSLDANPTDPINAVIINGGFLPDGRYLFGLNNAIAHFAFSRLLQSRVRMTAYGQVEKRDEYSQIASKDDLYESIRFHYEFGMNFLIHICEYYGQDLTTWDGQINEFYF